MKRRPLLAGNWKMHLNIADAVELAKNVAAAAEQSDRDVMIAPAFMALSAVAKALKGSRLFLGAQNVAWEAQGAFTGEIAPAKNVYDTRVSFILILLTFTMR